MGSAKPDTALTSWLRFLPAIIAGSAMLAAVLSLSLLASGNEQPPVQETVRDVATGAPAGGGVGGEGGEPYGEPRRVTEGDWTPVTIEDFPGPGEVVDRLTYYHIGEVINGFRIIEAGGGHTKSACPDAEPSDGPPPFELTYLPPNTFETAKPRVWTCLDGHLGGVHLSYRIGAAGFAFIDVNYKRTTGEQLAIGTGPVVRGISINGQPAVVVEPNVYRGKPIGQGTVVVSTPNGHLEIIGSSIPASETIKIAEGFQCTGC